MNQVFIFLISCMLLSVASSGSLFGNQGLRMSEQNIQPNHMSSLRQMSQLELLRQKFVLDILFNLQDRSIDIDTLMSQYGIDRDLVIKPEMCQTEMDEQMLYMMNLCNRCVEMSLADMYSLTHAEELRQIMGLYRLLVSARNFESLQEMAILARKCVNSRIFVYAFMSAIRDRQDTHMIILPKIYEILPEMYYTEEDMEELRHLDQKQEVNDLGMSQDNKYGYFDKSYIWMPFREMRRKLMLQKMGGRMPFVPMHKDNKIISLKSQMQKTHTLELFMDDMDLRAYVDNMICFMRRMMEQDEKLKTEADMRMRDYMQDKTTHRQGFGVSDAMRRSNKIYSTENRMNRVPNVYGDDMEYRHGLNRDYFHSLKNDYNIKQRNHINSLPTRDITDERLLHVGRRHKLSALNQGSNLHMNNYDSWQHYMMPARSGIREAHSVQNMDISDAADPRGLEMLDDYEQKSDYVAQHPYSYYLQQQFHKMRAQMHKNTMDNRHTGNYVYGMRHRRHAELSEEDKYQSGRILLHNIRQLMTRIRMERKSLGENESSFKNVYGADINLDRMRAIRLNKMGLDTRQSRLLIEQLNEMEKLIDMNIQHEMQMKMQGESEHEHMNIDRMMLNMLMGRIQGVSILDMLQGLEKEVMQQNIGGENILQMNLMKRRIHIAVMLHFLTRMEHLMKTYDQKYQEHYNLHDLMLPSVTVTDLKVDKLRTFIEQRDYDLVNMMHCKDMQQCMENGIKYARQPRLNHKSFDVAMQINSDRQQDVMMRIFLANKLDADFLLMDTRKLNLKQGLNSIQMKSSEIMWTMRDTTSYSELYQQVVLALQNQQQSKMEQISNQNCRFPHHLLLPRGNVDGLPMRLIVVVSSLDNDDMLMAQDHLMCAMGIGNIGMDHTFEDLRLNRYIKNKNDMDLLMSLPNIKAKDVLIYHE